MTDDGGRMMGNDNPSSVLCPPSSEAAQRAAVVAAARSWIGTPYHNCADIKGVGVDCGMLLVRVFVDLNLCPPFDPRPYPVDWHLHRSEERYLGFIFDRSAEATEPLPGDVMVFRYGRCYSHGGIVTAAKPLRIVHAYYQARMVIEDEVARNAVLADPARKPRFFSVWAKKS
jgi:cell wall-associated NlpC family hydrolase